MSEKDDDGWFVEHIFDSPFFFDDPKHVAAAVSGGSDSMALLSYLCLWADARGVKVSAITVDHGLRDGSADEAAFVAKHCAQRGIAHKVLPWQGWDGVGNLQAQARVARYDLIARYAREAGIDAIALGHTEDDQAENVLLRLGRVAGLDGLAEMAHRFERNGVTWIRPLLHRSRAKARAHLERQGIAWVEDPSNEDPRFDRVQARQILAQLAPLGITARGLAQTSHHLATAKAALEHYAFEAACTHAMTEGGDLLLPLHEPNPLDTRRRLAVAALQWIGREAYAPRRRALRDLEVGLMQAGTHTLAGCIVTRSEQHTRYSREWNAVKDQRAPTTALWDGRWRLDGAHQDEFEIAALGQDGLAHCPDWRDTGLPRQSLLSSPAIWKGTALIAAPVAGLENGWTATLAQTFLDFLARGMQAE